MQSYLHQVYQNITDEIKKDPRITNLILASNLIIKQLGKKYLIDYWGTNDKYEQLNDIEKFRIEKNICTLANILYQSSNKKNFDSLIKQIKKITLNGLISELQTASLLINWGFNLIFKVQEGIKGKDFDIIAKKSDQDFAVEVKNKNSKTIRSLESSIKEAKKQINTDNKSIICIKISMEMIDDKYHEVLKLISKYQVEKLYIIIFWEEEIATYNNNNIINYICGLKYITSENAESIIPKDQFKDMNTFLYEEIHPYP